MNKSGLFKVKYKNILAFNKVFSFAIFLYVIVMEYLFVQTGFDVPERGIEVLLIYPAASFFFLMLHNDLGSNSLVLENEPSTYEYFVFVLNVTLLIFIFIGFPLLYVDKYPQANEQLYDFIKLPVFAMLFGSAITHSGCVENKKRSIVFMYVILNIALIALIFLGYEILSWFLLFILSIIASQSYFNRRLY